MYEDAMQAIHNTLIRKSLTKKMVYTAELVPEQRHNGEMYVAVNPPLVSLNFATELGVSNPNRTI
jgi:hypothetical protein